MNDYPRPPKVQYLALKDEINDLLKKGYNYVSIHAILTRKGSMTMAYTSFLRYINLDKKQQQLEEKGSNQECKEQTPEQPQSKIISSDKATFGKKKSNPDENI